MKTSQLMEKIKACLSNYEQKMRLEKKMDQGVDVFKTHECLDDIQKTMSRYNRENFQEIMNSSPEDLTGDVDIDKLKDMKYRIDCYFHLHSPEDDEFKEFIKGISLYLTFVALKPLHPPGIIFSNKSTVYEKNGTYYCTGKHIFIKDELSLCKYCICHKYR
jgi:uncharacterized protein (UPF0305 family)